MSLIPINNVAQYGIVADLPDYELPPNAWTGGKNIRFLDGSVQKARGHSSVITPGVAPYALFPAPIPGSLFWVYCSLTKARAFIGAIDADITRVSGDYTATDTSQWQGGTFNGIFYLNNGVDDPQIWTPQATTTKLVQLTNWPASTKAKVLRHFKNYLIALDVTKSSTRYPRTIKWSHSAEPGTLPTSWDETNPALDAGEFPLSEGDAIILDCLPLGDINVVYTENETWGMRYVGGNWVFHIARIFPGLGLLAQGCVCNFIEKYVGRHFLISQDDIVIHDGSRIDTKIDKRLRSWFFSKLSSAAFYTTKVVPHFKDREIWVCFAQGGGTVLNTALIWNWRDDTWAIRDLPDVRALAIVPQALVGSGSTWDGLGGTWAAPTGLDSTWGDPTRAPYAQSIMVGSPSRTKILNVDDTLLFEGAKYDSYIEHTGIIAVAQAKDGSVIGDPNRQKMLQGVWPHISAAAGTIIDMTTGYREEPTDSITWGTPKQFTVGTDIKSDQYAVGRIMAIRFACQDQFKLEGYDLEIVPLGLL